MRWKNFGETTTKEGQKVFFSRKEDKHEHCVGFLVHKDIVNTVMDCRPVSSRQITIRLMAVPFNITIVQVDAPTSDYDDNKIEEFYDQLQNVIDQTPKKDILVVQLQGDWKATVGRDACGNGQGICGPFCNDDTNEEDSDFWSLPPLTTLCWRTHLISTKHPEDGHGIAQMDNTTTRLITFLWGSASHQEWTLPEHEVFQEQTLEVITTCWWWPSTFAWKESAGQNKQD